LYSNSGKKEKKKGPSFNISGVTVTAQVVLKATHDLDTLDGHSLPFIITIAEFDLVAILLINKIV
jgi:hypothetical protein